MSDTVERLRAELKDPEYSEGYAESFLDSYIATQIKVLRERDGLSQQGLAEVIGTRQGVISRIENVNYSKWNVTTLKKLARAFRVRLKVSFETYGSLLNDVEAFSRESLVREARECDRELNAPARVLQLPVRAAARQSHRKTIYPRSLSEKQRVQGLPCHVDEGISNSGFLGAAAQQQILSGHVTMAEMAHG